LSLAPPKSSPGESCVDAFMPAGRGAPSTATPFASSTTSFAPGMTAFAVAPSFAQNARCRSSANSLAVCSSLFGTFRYCGATARTKP
jgi:hypothetical protein